jgi:selenocysteine lyase/cysteine desulfurase
MKSYKQLFSKALEANPGRLHFAAHSHHLWPDCTEAAHNQAWLDASRLHDEKWQHVFGEILPATQKHIARLLQLPNPETICFAPNTHEFVVRLHSALDMDNPPRILTTDGEFHSFHRQHKRWQEAKQVVVDLIEVEPFADFDKRFIDAATLGRHDMVYLSHVFFNSGYAFQALDELAQALEGRDTLLVIDGYHAFMALPVSLKAIADQVFYLAGGYKYAMSGEGVCFLHCPPGVAPRPVNTGWFAGFDGLEGAIDSVGYADNGMRFAGATFDVSGLYRFNAVQDMLVNDPSLERGHFLTFRTKRAEEIHGSLREKDVMVDFRSDRLRFGFGLYQDPADVEELLKRLA